MQDTACGGVPNFSLERRLVGGWVRTCARVRRVQDIQITLELRGSKPQTPNDQLDHEFRAPAPPSRVPPLCVSVYARGLCH